MGHLQLTRPAHRNALDLDTARALREGLRTLSEDSRVRCLVLSGAGASFSAGGDIAALRRQTPAQTLELNATVLEAVEILERMPAPSIAAIHGHALGGGLELALGTTLRVCADDAVLGLPEVRLGLIPGSGGLARLPQLITAGAAARLLLTGDTVDGAEAMRLGLVDAVTPAAGLMATAMGLADRIARNGPLAVRSIHAALRAQRREPIAHALDVSARELPEILASQDAREGLAAFAERRPATFRGR